MSFFILNCMRSVLFSKAPEHHGLERMEFVFLEIFYGSSSVLKL
jgi:hypothetical protein